jgi:hypothetical protein
MLDDRQEYWRRPVRVMLSMKFRLEGFGLGTAVRASPVPSSLRIASEGSAQLEARGPGGHIGGRGIAAADHQAEPGALTDTP